MENISPTSFDSTFEKGFCLTAIAGDIESIGNHVVWITELSTQKAGKKVKFTESGKKELQESYVW